MRGIVLLLIIGQLSCAVLRKTEKDTSLKKLTFSVESVYKETPETFDKIGTYLEGLDSTVSINQIDSFKIKIEKLMREKVERESLYPNELYIEPYKNVWQRQRYFENRYTNKLRYHPENDSITVIDYKTDKIAFGSKLKRDSCSYNIKVDKERTKSINGHECFYAKLEEFSGDENFKDIFGSTVYEMWVTTTLNIPIYLVLKNDCIIEEQYFPLETKMYQSKLKNEYHLYELIKTE